MEKIISTILITLGLTASAVDTSNIVGKRDKNGRELPLTPAEHVAVCEEGPKVRALKYKVSGYIRLCKKKIETSTGDKKVKLVKLLVELKALYKELQTESLRLHYLINWRYTVRLKK